MDQAPIDIHAISAADLVARLKAPADEVDAANTLRHAYRRVFSSAIGRLVLVDIARSAGVATRRGPGLADLERAYTDGQMDLALEIMANAGFGPEAVAVFALTETLEGQETDDRTSAGHPDAGTDADPEF